MNLRLVSITVLTCLTTSLAFADDEIPNPLPCPSVSTIQQTSTKIDVAGTDDNGNSYTVRMQPFKENNLFWFVFAHVTAAKSTEEAIMIARKNVAATSTQKNEYAEPYFTAPIVGCGYGPHDVFAMGMQAPENGFNNLKTASLLH